MSMTTVERLHASKDALDAVFEIFGKSSCRESLQEIGAAIMAHCALMKAAVIECPRMDKLKKGALMELLDTVLEKAPLVEFGGWPKAVSAILTATRALEVA